MSRMQGSSKASVSSNVELSGSDKEPETPIKYPEDPEKGDVLQDMPNDPFDWNGPDDPENPRNWSKRKRFFHILPPAISSFTGKIGTSIYSPAVSIIENEFGVSPTVARLPLTLYVFALGFGPILAAPLSGTYGRHVVYTFSVPTGALFTLGAGFSPNIWTLCILRFFPGLSFSPSLSIGAGTNSDVNRPEDRAIPTCLYILSPFLGPALGPVLGSFVTVRKSWRWTQWTMIFFAILSILLGLPAPPSPFPTAKTKLEFHMTVTLIRPLHMLFTEPAVGFLSLYVGFNFSVLFGFFAAFPYVFESVYHFSTEELGLVFLAFRVGSLLAFLNVLLCDWFLYQPQVKRSHAEGRKGVVAPEYRLYPALMGCFGLPIGLFWFAWSARSDVSWVSAVVSAVPFAWENLSIFIAAATYLTDMYLAKTSASAMAANGFLRYTLGAAFPPGFTLQMYRGMGIGWATSLLGFVAVALMPVPWVLFKYGSKIRKRSNYDTLKV